MKERDDEVLENFRYWQLDRADQGEPSLSFCVQDTVQIEEATTHQVEKKGGTIFGSGRRKASISPLLSRLAYNLHLV